MIELNALAPLLEPVIRKFSVNPSVRSARGVACALYEWGDSFLTSLGEAAEANGYSRSCVDGCSFCCHQNVQISLFEAIMIGDWIRGNLEEKTRESIVRRAHVLRLNSSRDRDDSERWSRRSPCSCLDEETQRCLIYPVRPIECRLSFSHDRHSCQSDFDDALTKRLSVAPPEELSIHLPTIPNMSSPNSIAEFVSMSFIYSGFGSLIRFFISSPTSAGRPFSPTVQNKLLSMMNLELGNTLEYALKGDTDQRLKALVRLKGEALSYCEKSTAPV